ncbi:unnamed protein product [Phytophthora fragariaefolia]|uniref:Unnamed protein product n=1 Tax=Phytophthora fragariaefolia TaxID=1490495 RepID=A0A9W6XLJ6_9STRA|nr:unnamed protein product [Phytophthora fragariaefolia]
MTVRSIVQLFESMAASAGADSASSHALESPGRGNVYGLVTYYDALAVVEEPRVIAPTKTVRLVRGQPATADAEPQPTEQEQMEEGEQEQQEQGDAEEEEEEEEALEETVEEQQGETVEEQQESVEEQSREASNQDSTEPHVVAERSSAPSSPVKTARRCSLLMSKIPPPKSREFHLGACSVRKRSTDSAPRSRTSSSSSNDASQPLYAPPPTPVSLRVRAPGTSYAAFVSRIESSSSRLLDFEKDERWLEQVESMKGRVEALKRRNHLALAREVASTPRKCRSMSECSGVSTASTTSMSSMDTPEVSYQ